MSPKMTRVTDALHDYLVAFGTREEALLKQLREETRSHPFSMMQIAPEQGQFMRFLVSCLGVRRSVEVGVFTGYSALCTALGMPDDGRVLACDVDPETTRVATRYFEAAGLLHKLDLRIGDAVDTLSRALETEGEGSYDFAFIDADKENYSTYYELCLKLLKPGSVIAVDNVLWGGRVLDGNSSDESTQAIRAFNARVASDPRVDLSMLPLADGLTLLRIR
jgi:predicted O-methyltransferase YrrM